MSCNGYTYGNSYIQSQGINLNENDNKIRSSLSGATHTYGNEY